MLWVSLAWTFTFYLNPAHRTVITLLLCMKGILADLFSESAYYCKPQTREQTLVRDLYVLTVELLALSESGFLMFLGSKNFFLKIFKLYLVQLFSADALV